MAGMSASVTQHVVTVALVGNPNTGKSTIFNALCGARQHVANYPGVTVEKKIGRLRHGQTQSRIIDLPGTYSLSVRSPDELVAVEALLGLRDDTPAPDAVVSVVDASNLERNLFLTTQLMGSGLPLIVALNMTDVAEKRGTAIDVSKLADALGVPVIPLVANRGEGMDELIAAIAAVGPRASAGVEIPLAPELDAEAESIAPTIASLVPSRLRPRWLAQRLMLDPNLRLADALGVNAECRAQIAAARNRLAAQPELALASVESVARYDWIERKLAAVATHRGHQRSLADAIDRVVMHRLWGSLLFLLLMSVVFQSVFSWAIPLMDGLDALVGWGASMVEGSMAAGPLRSLLVDGVIAGVGGVVIFLPQILILFLLIGVLEDCGYLARAAHLMDKLMSKVGLSGKSFIPLLSSFACAVPAIMATRVIDNRRDRLVTILVAPLMSCSARLPVYTLLIAAFIPPTAWLGGWLSVQGLTMLAMYLLGAVVAVGVAWMLRMTLFRGQSAPFVLELPPYKIPSARVVLGRMLERGWAFIVRAGTLIFSCSIIIWALAYFPRLPASHAGHDTAIEEASDEESQQAAAASAQLEYSYLGRMGRWVEPVARPLGWDWRITAAAIASFPAREVFVGTISVIYSVGQEDDEGRALQERLRQARWPGTDRPVITIPVALGVMVFFALCAQCVSTLVVMYRETGSWRWPALAFVYMTTLAYLGALVTYQIGARLGT